MPLQKRVSDGALLKFDSGPNMGSLMKDCCCLPPVACPSGLNLVYSIVGYFDGMFDTSCIIPNPCIGGDVPWDGTFHQLCNPALCFWTPNSGAFCSCMNGIRMFSCGPDPCDDLVYLLLNGGANWEIRIALTLSFNSWTGTKTFGATPAGVYTKTGGCPGGPTTITIV